VWGHLEALCRREMGIRLLADALENHKGLCEARP